MKTEINNGCLCKNEIKKNQGGNIMKKMKNNKKGFSLIELLIVVAILAILAAISINLFGGVLTRQKNKSDQAACSYLQTAIQTYIYDSGDSSLSAITNKTTAADIIKALSDTITYDSNDYGPYLNKDKATLSNPDNKFIIKVDTDDEVVTVTYGSTESVVVNTDPS